MLLKVSDTADNSGVTKNVRVEKRYRKGDRHGLPGSFLPVKIVRLLKV
jgi:hypothetical protein